MSKLKYKGFQGSVTYDNGKLLIQVLHIDDTLMEECDSASSAQAAFEDLVDDYIETCELVGKAPNKPFSGSFNVRIKPNTHKQAAQCAADDEITLNAFVESAIEQKVHSSNLSKVIADYVIKRPIVHSPNLVVSSRRHARATSTVQDTKTNKPDTWLLDNADKPDWQRVN